METLQQFITILIPLVIIMDPLGNLPFFLLFTEQNTLNKRRKMAGVASLAACLILIFFSLTGDFVLNLFKIGLPAFQVAGGLIFFIYALQMLQLIPSGIKTTHKEEQEGIEKNNVSIVPLATPMLAGPGAITAVLVRQQNPENSVSNALLFIAIITACLVIYFVFYFGEWIRKVLGVGGLRVVTRLMGLLLAVIAVQFVVSGFQQLR
ncbi:MAG: MarC family protein [Deltaproteobacteria bacterium]|nr:MarC family protein [Deltaproteobacteria bacterium]